MAYASNHLLLCPLNPQEMVGVQVNPPTGSLSLHFIFPFFFFFPFSRSSTDSKAQSLQSKKQSWVSHGVQGQDGLSIPNPAGRQQDTSGISFPHGGPAAQGEERWMLHRPCCVCSKSSCFYSPLEECRGGHTSRAGPVKQQFPQQAPPITPGDSLNVV